MEVKSIIAEIAYTTYDCGFAAIECGCVGLGHDLFVCFGNSRQEKGNKKKKKRRKKGKKERKMKKKKVKEKD